jgi:hypothetical protein
MDASDLKQEGSGAFHRKFFTTAKYAKQGDILNGIALKRLIFFLS